MKEYIILYCTVFTALIPLYLIIRRPFRVKEKLMRRRELLLGFFVIFMCALFFLCFRGAYTYPSAMFKSALFRIRTGEMISLTPFKNLNAMRLYDERDHYYMNLFGNILMFIPWGFFRPLLWKKKQNLPSALLGAFLLTLFIEFVQLFIWRNCDIDDIILNSFGSLVGSLIYYIVKRLQPDIVRFSI